jgi:hypothetical protein
VNRILRAAEALGVRPPRNVRQTLAKLAALVLALTGLWLPGLASSATLSSARVSLSDPRPSATGVSYNFTGSSVSNASIKCVKEVFTTTATGSTKPTSMVTASGITLNASSSLVTAASWSRGGSDPDGTVTFTYATGETPAAGTKTFNLDGFTNSATADTAFFLHYSTYDNVDCSTTPVDNVTVEYILTAGSLMSLTIDNTLSFTVNGIAGSTLCGNGGNTTGLTTSVGVTTDAVTIPFGTVTSASNAIACQKLTAATNATGGYTIYIRDQAQLSNTLGQLIPDVGSNTGSYTNGYTNTTPNATFTKNTSAAPFNQGAYGYTTSDSSLGTGTADRFTNGGPKFASYGHGTTGTANAEVGYESAGVTSTDYYIAHEVGITTLTQPGYYTTTVVYTCTPVY